MGTAPQTPRIAPFTILGPSIPIRPRAQTGLKNATPCKNQSSTEILTTPVLSPRELFSVWSEHAHPRSTVGAASWRCFPHSKPWPVTCVRFFQVYGLLDTMVTDLMVLADELNPQRDVEQPLRPCT